MSLKLVGIVALAGISAVAAYFMFVRKKEEESFEEQGESEVKRSEKEQPATPSSKNIVEVEEVGISPLDSDLALSAVEAKGTTVENCGVFTEENVSVTSENKAAEINDEVETSCRDGDLNNKTESLMEWIDRQLAESRSRNSTPAPEFPSKEDESSANATKVENEYSSNGTKNVEDLDEGSTSLKEKESDNSLDSIEMIEMNEVENMAPHDDIVQTCDPEETFGSSTSFEIHSGKAISVDVVETKIVDMNDNSSDNPDEITTHEEQKENKTVGECDGYVAPSECQKTGSDLSNEFLIEVREKVGNIDVATIESVSTSINIDGVRKDSFGESKLQDIKASESEDPLHVTKVPTIEPTERCDNSSSDEKEEMREIVANEIASETGSLEEKVAAEEYKDVVESENFVADCDNVRKVSSDDSKYEVSKDVEFSDDTSTSITDFKESRESLDSSEIIKDESILPEEKADLDTSANLCKSISEKGTVAASEESSDETDLASDAEVAKSGLISNTTDIDNINDNKKNDDESDVEIQLLKGSSDNKSYILEDSDSSGNYSDSGSSEESTNKATPSDLLDEDYETKSNGSKEELNDSIGLMLRPSWQLKNTQKAKSKDDAKLTSI